MIKIYDFYVAKIVEKKLPSKDEFVSGTSIFKVLYLEIDGEKLCTTDLENISECISSAKNFHIGYISKIDTNKIYEGMFVKGFFDENGKIKLIG